MSHLTIDGDTLLLRSSYSDYQKCKSVPSGHWDKKRRVWVYPLSPISIADLAAAFGRGCFDESVQEYERRFAECVAPEQDGKTRAWAHQAAAFQEAYRRPGYMLALDMGTGKTKVAIDLACAWGADSVLVLCPKAVVNVWPAEFQKHCARPYVLVPLDGRSVKKRTETAERMLSMGRPTLLVINYEAAICEPFRTWSLDRQWDLVIADECAHLKAPGGKQSRYAALLRDRAEHRLGLTGTPAPHSPLDLYAQFRFLDPAVFGTSFTLFRARYAVMGGYGGHEVIRYQNEEEMTRRFRMASYRVTKRDVLDLPPVMTETLAFDLTGPECDAYGKLEREFYVWLAEAGKEVTVTNALTKLLRLQQATNGYLKSDDGALVRLGRSKLDAFRELLDDLPLDEPLVVFCRFAEEGADLDMIKTEVADSGREYLELSGHANQLSEWQRGDAPVLVAQIQAGSEGVDLTRAAYCCFFSLGFSLGQYEQALARLDRPGQTRPVTYYHLVARESVDEKVVKALAERKEVVEAIIGSRT